MSDHSPSPHVSAQGSEENDDIGDLQDFNMAEKDTASNKRKRHNTSFEDQESIMSNLNKMGIEVDDIRAETGHVSSEVESLATGQAQMAKQIEFLTNIVIKQDKIIGNIQKGLVDQQRRSMKNNVVIYNVKEKDNEDCGKVALEAITAKGVKVDYMIERAHRIGQKRSQGGNPRPLIVRMVRQDQAFKVLQAARPAKGHKPVKGEIKIMPQTQTK